MVIHLEPCVDILRAFDNGKPFEDPFIMSATVVYSERGKIATIKACNSFAGLSKEAIRAAFQARGVELVTWQRLKNGSFKTIEIRI